MSRLKSAGKEEGSDGREAGAAEREAEVGCTAAADGVVEIGHWRRARAGGGAGAGAGPAGEGERESTKGDGESTGRWTEGGEWSELCWPAWPRSGRRGQLEAPVGGEGEAWAGLSTMGMLAARSAAKRKRKKKGEAGRDDEGLQRW